MSIETVAPGAEQIEYGQPEEDLKKMATGRHSGISARLIRYLGPFVDDNNSGYTLDSSALYNFHDNQSKRQPDVSFISLERLPELPDEELTIAPDLAVEVVSKNDTVYEVESKVKQYQQAGVKLIWIIHPASQTVDVYHLASGLKPQSFIGDEELDGEEVVQGFKLAVKKLFK